MTAAALAAFVLVGLIVCVLVTLATDRVCMRRLYRSVKAREADAALRSRALDKRLDVVKGRERRVAEAEQNLRRTAQEVSARVNRDAEHFDTMVTTLDPDSFPNPYENADTVQMSKVEL